jgi:hypothetical protein
MSRRWLVLQICLGVSPIDDTCTFTQENFSSFMICWTGAVRQREVSWKETANSLMLKRKCHGFTRMVVNHDSSKSYTNVINFCIDALFAFFVLSLLFFFVFGVLFDFFFCFWVSFFHFLCTLYNLPLVCKVLSSHIFYNSPLACKVLSWVWVGLYSCHSFERAIP